MESATSDLRAALGNEFEFFFPTAPYGDDPSSRIWVPDPPSKNEPTTSPDVANLSLALLDNEVATNGPFWGIMGYSQGSAFATVYTAYAPSGTFNATILFCGYLTETHLGLLGIVNDATPFGDIPALVWMGTDDATITNTQTTDQSQMYTNPTVITQNSGGHVVPGNFYSTFTQVRDWIVATASSPAPAPTPTTSRCTRRSAAGSRSSRCPTSPSRRASCPPRRSTGARARPRRPRPPVPPPARWCSSAPPCRRSARSWSTRWSIARCSDSCLPFS